MILTGFSISLYSLKAGAVGGRSDYIVDNLALGDAVYPEGAVYKSYACRRSQDFSGFVWCARHRERSGKFGSYTSWVSLLHSSSNRVVFITEEVEPAFFAPGDVDREIERLSKGFGQAAHTFPAKDILGLPHAILATWGDVTLTPLDESAIEALRRGEEPHSGLVADFIGDARKSARSGLPVFSIGGGPGFIWGASFDGAGKGSLRSSAVDVSELGRNSSTTYSPVASTGHGKQPILSPYAPAIMINNNSCINITDVIVDGAKQPHGIGPGNNGSFHMSSTCNHTVEGVDEGANWNSTIQCRGVPYENYTLNWIYNSHPTMTEPVAEDSLIVETRYNDSYGELKITSKINCIAIEKIVVNRGNCNASTPDLPIAVKLGQTVSVPYFCSKLLEVSIATDQGTSVFTWER